jgi:hypothetical protein
MKDDKKKESAEKTKIRRILREKDLKKHLKGKRSFDGVVNEDEPAVETPDKEKDEASISLEAELKKDHQLMTAISLLEGWDIMQKTLKPSSKNINAGPSQISMN